MLGSSNKGKLVIRYFQFVCSSVFQIFPSGLLPCFPQFTRNIFSSSRSTWPLSDRVIPQYQKFVFASWSFYVWLGDGSIEMEAETAVQFLIIIWLLWITQLFRQRHWKSSLSAGTVCIMNEIGYAETFCVWNNGLQIYKIVAYGWSATL
jgi:hypothetical protein